MKAPLLAIALSAIGLMFVQSVRAHDVDIDTWTTDSGWEFRSGEVNGEEFESTKYSLGDTFEFEDGTVGGRPFSCTTTHIGSYNYTECD